MPADLFKWPLGWGLLRARTTHHYEDLPSYLNSFNTARKGQLFKTGSLCSPPGFTAAGRKKNFFF